MSTKVAKTFNKLFSTQTERLSGEWRFDLRYIHLEPTPGHILFLFHPQSKFIHSERLPLGISDKDGFSFFPESAEEAAPEIAKALLDGFVKNHKNEALSVLRTSPQLGQWRLTTEESDLADAVERELKRIGVQIEEFHTVGVSTGDVNKKTQAAFAKFFHEFVKKTGASDNVAKTITNHTPSAIVGFHSFKDPSRQEDSKDVVDADQEAIRTFQLATKYTENLFNNRPKIGDRLGSNLNDNLYAHTLAILESIEKAPEPIIKYFADNADPLTAMDYGMRLMVGLGCKRNRTLCRSYFIKALRHPSLPDNSAATIHSLLIEWYLSFCPKLVRMRYLFAACHHANRAASISHRIGAGAPPNVLGFIKTRLIPGLRDAPEFKLFYPDLWKAWDISEKKLVGSREKLVTKRLKNPIRYRCATAGCGVGADRGTMLFKCGGKCDRDKKPSYCSKECQKADWKNHKPFCAPGKPCSIIDTSEDDIANSALPLPKEGSLQIPVQAPDGSTVLLSSSTMDANKLKELREHSEVMDWGWDGWTKGMRVEYTEYGQLESD